MGLYLSNEQMMGLLSLVGQVHPNPSHPINRIQLEKALIGLEAQERKLADTRAIAEMNRRPTPEFVPQTYGSETLTNVNNGEYDVSTLPQTGFNLADALGVDEIIRGSTPEFVPQTYGSEIIGGARSRGFDESKLPNLGFSQENLYKK